MSQSSLYVAGGLFAMVASWYVLPLQWMALLSFLARLLSGLRARKIIVDDVRWQYLEGGQGPTLVLLHGLAAEADHWLGVAGPVRHQFHLLIPDLPGFGASQHPQDLNFRIEAQSLRLEQWLKALGVSECIIAGNSMGAWIAADFAARNPKMVRALWLQDPFGVESATKSVVMEEFLTGHNNPFKVESMSDYRQLAALMFHKPPHVPYALARAGYLNTARLKDELPRMQDEFLRQSTSMDELAPKLTMPVLIEWGLEDRATHPDGARVLHELIPNSDLVTHEEVGHLPMLEAPSLSTQAFSEFLETHQLVKTH
jgi:pimeloyl-ACP methyl ester carboxylesterase